MKKILQIIVIFVFLYVAFLNLPSAWAQQEDHLNKCDPSLAADLDCVSSVKLAAETKSNNDYEHSSCTTEGTPRRKGSGEPGGRAMYSVIVHCPNLGRNAYVIFVREFDNNKCEILDVKEDNN